MESHHICSFSIDYQWCKYRSFWGAAIMSTAPKIAPFSLSLIARKWKIHASASVVLFCMDINGLQSWPWMSMLRCCYMYMYYIIVVLLSVFLTTCLHLLPPVNKGVLSRGLQLPEGNGVIICVRRKFSCHNNTRDVVQSAASIEWVK